MSNDHPQESPDAVGSQAELEKIRLEIEKLRAEITNKRGSKGVDSIVRLTPLFTVLIAVIGFGFTVYQYRAEQAKNRQERAAQSAKEATDREERSRRDTEIAQREFMKPLLERQHDLYFQASSSAATIASSKDPEDRRKAINTFWKLYWGPLVFVESTDVSKAMERFGNCLNGTENCDEGELKNRSLRLASAMEESILKTWNIRPEEFGVDQFKYH